MSRSGLYKHFRHQCIMQMALKVLVGIIQSCAFLVSFHYCAMFCVVTVSVALSDTSRDRKRPMRSTKVQHSNEIWLRMNVNTFQCLHPIFLHSQSSNFTVVIED